MTQFSLFLVSFISLPVLLLFVSLFLNVLTFMCVCVWEPSCLSVEFLALCHSSKAQDRFPVKTPVTNRSGSVAASAFDENFLNQSQFIQLVEVFLGEEPSQEVIDALVKYLKEGYVETEEEKFLRLQKVRIWDMDSVKKINMLPICR